PAEALTWLREERALAANVSPAYGGQGMSLAGTSGLVQALARHCSTTAMTMAMHWIQTACLERHGRTPHLDDFLRETVDKQLLIASVTSEAGVGGDLRRSQAPVERGSDSCFVSKKASTISYGASADAYLLTARRAPDAEESDQVLVLLRRDQTELQRQSTWDALGMRGTCSEAFVIEGHFPPEGILPDPFARIAEKTMVPVSHMLWASCWLGIAAEAFHRARTFTRAQAGRGQIADLTLARLSHMAAALDSARCMLDATIRWYEEQPADSETTLAQSVRLNNLKLTVSQTAQEIVLEALAINGMAGYSEQSDFSIARLLRDVLSSGLMISNDRLTKTNGGALLAVRNFA
ncbi:MAG: acyl-CoA/acyl-ACP dehydrogenase, partial [Chloroflexi bacterium]|nr:acyl-CoA/acyl-ACP dehydrogenase [Chloroflexota bacterium]